MRPAIVLLLVLALTSEGGDPKPQDKTVQEWIVQLDAKQPLDRHAACLALADFGRDAKAAVPALTRLVKEVNDPPRRAAIHALGKIGPAALPALPVLLDTLKTADADLRLHLIPTIGAIGPRAREAVPRLVALARDRDRFTSTNALKALGTIGEATPAVLEVLEELLDHSDGLRVMSAGRSLASLPPTDEAVRKALLKVVNHKNEDARADVRRAMWRWHEAGPIPKGTADALLSVLLTRIWYSSFARVEAAEQIGPFMEKEHLPKLREALTDSDWVVRLHIAALLAVKFGEAKDMMPLFREGLTRHDSELTTACEQLPVVVAALPAKDRQRELDAVLPSLRLLMKGAKPGKRASAAAAVFRLAEDGKDGLTVLLDNLAGKEGGYRWYAARTLAPLGDKASPAVPALRKALKCDFAPARADCAEALGRIGKAAHEARADLVEAMKDENGLVRAAAATALLRLGLGGKAERDVLVGLFDHPDAQVRIAAIKYVGSLGAGEVELALPALREALLDPNLLVRREAYYVKMAAKPR